MNIADKYYLWNKEIKDEEFFSLEKRLKSLGCCHVSRHKCSKNSALTDDYTKIDPEEKPQLVFVAAGIGAAKVVVPKKGIGIAFWMAGVPGRDVIV